MTVLTEVLPPPCKTSLGSRPSKRGGVDVQREVAPDHKLCILATLCQ
jgi:hypothetical protein